MKVTMHTYNKYYRKASLILLFFFILLIVGHRSSAQNDSPLRLYLDIMSYQNDSGVELRSSVRARIGENRKILPVEGLSIDFYNLTDTTETLLGSVTSNSEGVASLFIEGYKGLQWDEEEGYLFMASFQGSDRFRKGSKDLSVRQAEINIGFEEVDSIKMISVQAFEINPLASEKIPLDDITVSFYVKGSFSLYRIGEEDLEDGVCAVNFPVSLPGDETGNLTIIAKVEEDDDYGYVEGSAIKDWGVVKLPVIPEERRGLGDTDAPLWMVYTLIFLLSAVWIHYIYVFIVVYLIKRDSRAR